MTKRSSSNNILHSMVWNIIIYFSIIFFGEMICGALAGVVLDTVSFRSYELFSEIDLLMIAVSTIIARGIGMAVVHDYGAGDSEKYENTCARGLRISLISGVVLAAAAVVVSLFWGSDVNIASTLDISPLSCFLFVPICCFLFPIMSVLREYAYIRGCYRGSIASAIVYAVVYCLFTYLFADGGLGAEAIFAAHDLAALSTVCVLWCCISRSGQDVRFFCTAKPEGSVRDILLSGLPVGLGYAWYSISVYLFAQVPIVTSASGNNQNNLITYGSLSLGIQVISFIIMVILMTSTLSVLLCTGSLTGDEKKRDADTALRRLMKFSGIIWLVIGIVLFAVAHVFADAMRITVANEINITLIGLRICALTLWTHSLVWILIQYYAISRERKMWIVSGVPLIAGYAVIIVILVLFPESILGAWLLYAFTPVFSLIAICVCRKKRPGYVRDEEASAESDGGSVIAQVRSVLPGAKHIVLGLLASVLFVGGIIATTLTYYEIAILPDVSEEKLFVFDHRSKVIANDGTTVLSDLYFPRHETISDLDEVSPYVAQAVIAREDCRFYEHNGVDLKSFARAAVRTFTGQGLEGGSTITMQLIKNSVLANTGQFRTVDRKISEIMLALRMERLYDKDTILRMYLNNTNFGNGYYGIRSASRHYFRKEPKDLTLAEAVSLSTLIQRPNDMRLVSNDEFALKARARTLNIMAREGYISEEEAKQASSELLNWNPFEVIINHSKITPTLSYDPILTDEMAYLSAEDVSRYIDTHLYFGADEGVIATFGVGGVAEFDLKNGTLTINDETVETALSSPKKVDGIYYLPLQCLADLYGMDVYQDDDTLLITTRDQAIISAKVESDASVNYLNSDRSYKVGTVHKGDLVYVQDTKGDVYDGWSRIRTDDNAVGYIRTENLSARTIVKKAQKPAETIEIDEPLRITWDRVVNYDHAGEIIADAEGAFNMVMPFCYEVEDGKVLDKKEVVSDDYIRMFNDAGFYLFPTFHYVAYDDQDMDFMSGLLSSYFSRKALIRQILYYVDCNHLKGINIDFEHMYMSDAPNFTQFIRELKAQLEPRGCLLFVDVITPDGDDNWSGCYEYWKLGKVVDYMILMAYEHTSKFSETPGSGAPYFWVASSVDKLVHRENVDPGKVILSMPLYMRFWEVDDSDGTVIGSTDITIAAKDANLPADADITWLEEAKQHFAKFTDSEGVHIQSWLEDMDSLTEKMQLIPEYRLAGAAFWTEEYSNAKINAAIAEELQKAFDEAAGTTENSSPGQE